MSSSSSSKVKKTKEREKKRSQVHSESTSSDKGSPAKECKQFAGISPDSIYIYNEQNSNEHLSEEVCNTLTEDINYRLRYIIHDSLLKARLLGRDVIKYKDIEETFENLSISKVYGATATPNWRPFDEQNLLFLDDQKVNLSEFIEKEDVYGQYCKISIIKGWYPQEPGPSLKIFFNTACHALLSNNERLWKLTLRTISENPRVGPITKWFYHFGYFMLMKYMPTVTLRALYLIETLENSPLGSTLVSIKQLNLLVRLILQRLVSSPKKVVLKPLCSVLATLCLREPLMEMAISKIIQKLPSLYEKHTLALLTMIYFLGIEAVLNIFLPNLNTFLENITGCVDQDVIFVLMGIYGQICRANFNDTYIQTRFVESLGDRLVLLWKPFRRKDVIDIKDEINFVPMKTQLIKTRRKVDVEIRRGVLKPLLENIFEIPEKDCKVKKVIDNHREGLKTYKKETHIIVGKTTLLLSVLKCKRMGKRMKYGCCDHSLLAYNF